MPKSYDASRALSLAIAMERRAIQMYERALNLFDDDALNSVIRFLLGEEKCHLQRFQDMLAPFQQDVSQSPLIASQAGDMLFPGGLIGAARSDAFASAQHLVQYAAEQEEDAVKKYRVFAGQCDGNAQAAFLSIAEEEQNHLRQLQDLAAHLERDAAF